MNTHLRHIALSVLGSCKTIAPGVHILNSHFIGRNNLPSDVFYNLLKNIQKQADFIRVEDAVKAIKDKTHQHQKLIAFTFDDGFLECFTHVAPVLEEFKTNAAFFINPGFIDGDESYRKYFTEQVVHVSKEPMSWEMIRKLHDRNFVIGNHTMDHVRLTGLSQDVLKVQVSSAKKRIEEIIGAPCTYFAWTYGRNSDIDEQALQFILKEHSVVFGGDNYTKYYSFDNRVINRRHIEGNWPLSHIAYFLSKGKHY